MSRSNPHQHMQSSFTDGLNVFPDHLEEMQHMSSDHIGAGADFVTKLEPDSPESVQHSPGALASKSRHRSSISSSVSGGNRKGNSAERRATHNAIERARRESLNTRFLQLAATLPATADVRRPSKSLIVNKSLEFVVDAMRRDTSFRLKVNQLRSEADELREQLNEYRQKDGLEPLEARPDTVQLPAPFKVGSGGKKRRASTIQEFGADFEGDEESVDMSTKPEPVDLADDHHSVSNKSSEFGTTGSSPAESQSNNGASCVYPSYAPFYTPQLLQPVPADVQFDRRHSISSSHSDGAYSAPDSSNYEPEDVPGGNLYAGFGAFPNDPMVPSIHGGAPIDQFMPPLTPTSVMFGQPCPPANYEFPEYYGTGKRAPQYFNSLPLQSSFVTSA